MLKRIVLGLGILGTVFGQTLSDFIQSNTKVNDMKLSVDKPYGVDNTRRDVYGKLLGKYTPGYKNYYFYMTEDELKQAMLDNKIISNFSEIKTLDGDLYIRTQPKGSFVHYDPSINKLYELNFTNDLDGIKKVGFQGLSNIKPIYKKDYKELFVEANGSLPTEWDFHFLLLKENSVDASNTNPYRLVGLTMVYRDTRANTLGQGVYPIQGDTFEKLMEKVSKQLGVPYAKEDFSFSNYISRTESYYFQDVKIEKAKFEEGLLVAALHKGHLGVEINVTSLKIGQNHANFSVTYADPVAMKDLIAKMENAIAVQQLYPQKPLLDLQ